MIIFIIAALVGLYFYFKENSNISSSDYSQKSNYSSRESVRAYRKQSSKSKNYESKQDRNKRIIDSALLKGSDITFRYVDRVGTITNRRVTPKKVFMYQLEENGGQMLCLETYCHLRKDKRTFALFRMEEINLLN